VPINLKFFQTEPNEAKSERLRSLYLQASEPHDVFDNSQFRTQNPPVLGTMRVRIPPPLPDYTEFSKKLLCGRLCLDSLAGDAGEFCFGPAFVDRAVMSKGAMRDSHFKTKVGHTDCFSLRA
jgi:hypothetical protein